MKEENAKALWKRLKKEEPETIDAGKALMGEHWKEHGDRFLFSVFWSGIDAEQSRQRREDRQ